MQNNDNLITELFGSTKESKNVVAFDALTAEAAENAFEETQLIGEPVSVSPEVADFMQLTMSDIEEFEEH